MAIETSNDPTGDVSDPRSSRAGGRKRDATRDDAILRATIDVMVEIGFEKMTVDMVAARARAGKGAVYRRWPSKSDLVLDAIVLMKRDTVDFDHLTDTGTLRGDMLALFDTRTAARDEHFVQTVTALSALLAQQPDLATEGHQALIEPWAEANRILIGRAVARGEARADADVEALSQVIPSMGGYRSLIQRHPFDRPFLIGLLDHVLLPALGIPPRSELSEDK